MLKQLIVGRLGMEPDRAARFYRFNDAVLKAIASDVLRPAVVSAVIDGFLDHLLPANVESRVEDLRFTGPVATGKLIAGAVQSTKVASPMPASWNRIVPWLRQIDGLRQAA